MWGELVKLYTHTHCNYKRMTPLCTSLRRVHLCSSVYITHEQMSEASPASEASRRSEASPRL